MNRGFTLIELVAALALLAILAASIASRYADLQQEARSVQLQAMADAAGAGARLIHAQAALEGLIEGRQNIDLDGTVVQLHSGYPRGHWNNAVRYMITLDNVRFTNATTVCADTWCGRGNQRNVPGYGSTPGRGAKIWPRGYRWSDRCGVFYINHEDGRDPEVGVDELGC
ncbi:prepilin-type N-terminal cleavage/methylation domain-containing protein [Agaribacterium haliotis]|uniref:prepilin-type N-terminal cleavage/methylation domain-containing protein n=1 Tax=Agaribacterium haliotis TaxID=2013869 RepID=UPI000BB594E3|nr:prepilin-type N-terminal cleavage/methylation domain-containing protein [Agaribacterium haliotis]